MRQVTKQVAYTVKETGEKVVWDETVGQVESLQEYIDTHGEDKALAVLNQVLVEDHCNNAREAKKRENGHSSTHAPLSEEAKAERKAERAKKQAMVKKLMSLDPAKLAELGIDL